MQSTAYRNARVTVEWPYEDHIPAIRCPITGMVVSLGYSPDQEPGTDAPLTPTDEKCPTLMFRFNSHLGMEYMRPELEQAVADKKRELVESGEFDDEEDLDDLEVISEYLDDLGEAPLIIDMPTYGLPGDGIVIGFDLARAVARD
ncbi:MAG: hypothetical protein U5L08_07705 [Xanthomonadales bacterium]|nr:hypothetical protein [Xanthomonadales bacterium]